MGRKTLIGCLSHIPRLGIEPATWVCALTGNRTGSISVNGTMLQPTVPHQPGQYNNALSKDIEKVRGMRSRAQGRVGFRQ